MLNKLGLIQGRLLKREIKSKLQSFPWSSWQKEFFLMKKIGLKNLEWTLDYKDFLKNPINTKKGNVIIKKLKKKYKIQIKSITCDFFMQKPFYKKKFEIYQDKIFNYLKILIKNSSNLNVKYLILPLVDKSSLENKNEEKKLIFALSKLEKLLKKENIEILFECDYEPKKLNSFIKKFDTKLFGINYDTGNSTNLNYKFEKEMINYRYIKNVHLKDRKINGSSKRFGKGDTNFKKIISFFEKNNYKGKYIFQSYVPISKNSYKEFQMNLNFIKKIFRKNDKNKK